VYRTWPRASRSSNTYRSSSSWRAANWRSVARRHLLHLDSDERRRLTKLLRRGRALTGPERKELRALIAKLDMRGLAGSAANQLSPLPLPRRLTRARYR